VTTRTAYIEKIKHQLDELNASMAQLEGRAQDAKVEARASYYAEMAKLRAQSDMAMAKLEEIKSGTEEGWEKVIAEMDKVRDAFVHAFRDFKARM